MKLQELIDQLQKIENERHGTDVFFQKASNQGGYSFQTSPLYFLDFRLENGQGKSMITFGNLPADAKQYKEYLEIREENNRRFQR